MKKGLYYDQKNNIMYFGKTKKHYELIPHVSINIPKSLICRLIDRRALNEDSKTFCLSICDMNENQFFKMKHAFENGIIHIMFYNSRTKLKLFTTMKTFKIRSLIPKLYVYDLKYVYDNSCLKH